MLMQKVAIIGIGLIGGSIAHDLRQQGMALKIIGIDNVATHLAYALQTGMIDEGYDNINQAVSAVDMVILATPPAALAENARQLALYLDKNMSTIITDVASTKQNSVAVFQHELADYLPYCVAAHPIAGSDRSGTAAAQQGLFVDKKTIICPHKTQNAAAVDRVRQMWQGLGAQVHELSAAEHDCIFAAVSHLPHLAAFAYMQLIGQSAAMDDLLYFAGSGFRDFTRIGGSHPAMWRDIALLNRQALLSQLANYRDEINALIDIIEKGDAVAINEYFSRASAVRQAWQQQHNPTRTES